MRRFLKLDNKDNLYQHNRRVRYAIHHILQHKSTPGNHRAKANKKQKRSKTKGRSFLKSVRNLIHLDRSCNETKKSIVHATEAQVKTIIIGITIIRVHPVITVITATQTLNTVVITTVADRTTTLNHLHLLIIKVVDPTVIVTVIAIVTSMLVEINTVAVVVEKKTRDVTTIVILSLKTTQANKNRRVTSSRTDLNLLTKLKKKTTQKRKKTVMTTMWLQPRKVTVI